MIGFYSLNTLNMPLVNDPSKPLFNWIIFKVPLVQDDLMVYSDIFLWRSANGNATKGTYVN